MENQEQSGSGRGRRRRRGGRRGNGRGRGRGAILPRGPPRAREAFIRITEVLLPPRQQTPLDCVQRTFIVDINAYRVYTTVTCSAEAIDTWVQETCEQYPHRPLLVGLGVQMGTYRRVTHVQSHPFASTHVQISELVHILQLCVRNRCLVIQLSRTLEIPDTLERFLLEQRFVGLFEGAGPKQLLYYASHHKIVFCVENFVNLVSSGVGFGEDSSMEGFALRELGLSLRLDPAVRNSYWGVEVLDELQVFHESVEASLALLIEMWVQDTSNYYPQCLGLSVQMGYYRYRDSSVVVDILQLCVKNRCLIIQLARTEPETLERFLLDQRFVGLFEGASPEQLLYYASPHKIVFRVENFVSLVSSGVGFGEDSSMEGFALRELGLSLRLDPEVRNSYWGVEVLDELQVCHACVEARLNILQICVGNRCLIIQLSLTPNTLGRCLSVPDIRTVRSFYGAGPKQFLLHHTDVGLISSKKLIGNHLIVQHSKAYTLENRRRFLTACQNSFEDITCDTASRYDPLLAKIQSAFESRCLHFEMDRDRTARLHGTTILVMIGTKNILVGSDGLLTDESFIPRKTDAQKIFQMNGIVAVAAAGGDQCEALWTRGQLNTLIQGMTESERKNFCVEKLARQLYRQVEMKIQDSRDKLPNFDLVVVGFNGRTPFLFIVNNHGFKVVKKKIECVSHSGFSTFCCLEVATRRIYNEEHGEVIYVEKTGNLIRQAIVKASDNDPSTGGGLSIMHIASPDSIHKTKIRFLRPYTVAAFKEVLKNDPTVKVRKLG